MLEAHATNFLALSRFLLAFSIPHAHVYSQPAWSVMSCGAAVYPILPLTGEDDASSEPAAEVASYHIAVLPPCMAARHSGKLKVAAPASP